MQKDNALYITPGPWSCDPTGDIGWWMVGTPDKPVAEVSMEVADKREAKANARLIAVAPELLDTVRVQEKAINACVRFLLGTGRQPTPDDMADAVNAARDVMAKIKGR